MAPAQTAEAVLEYFSEGKGHPFDAVTRLSDLTEHKGFRYSLLQVSLDFGHRAFPAVQDLLDEMGGSEFQVIVVETPEQSVYVIVDKDNLPEEEARPDHPMLAQLADWLGKALAMR